MYYYLIVVKKMYISEPHDPSPLRVSGPIKAVVYVCLAGTLAIGIYPQPVTDWVVSAILMFSNLADPTASLPVPPPAIPSVADPLPCRHAPAPSSGFCKIFLAGSFGGGYSFQVQCLTPFRPYVACSEPWNPSRRNVPAAPPLFDRHQANPDQLRHTRHHWQTGWLMEWFTHWSIERRVLAGFGLVFAGIVVISVISYRNTAVLIENSRLDTKSHELVQLLGSIGEALDRR